MATESRSFPKSILVLLVICFLGLVGAVVTTYAYSAKTNDRLAVLEEFVEGRGEARDRENDRLQEQIRRGLCDLLDQLPSTPLLDGPRTKYGCGPGLQPRSI